MKIITRDLRRLGIFKRRHDVMCQRTTGVISAISTTGAFFIGAVHLGDNWAGY